MRKLGGSLILAAALAAVARPARAVTVDPSRQEIRLPVGGKADGQVVVGNDLTMPVQVTVTPKDWFILPENKGLTIDKWFILKGDTQFVLEPGQKRVVPFSISLSSASGVSPSGMLMGMLSFLSQTEQGQAVSLVVSVSVYAVVQGTEHYGGTLKSFSLARDGEHMRGYVDVTNTGNVHLRPLGFAEIFDRKGRFVDRITFREGWPVFPGGTQDYLGEIDWPRWKGGPYFRAHVKVTLLEDQKLEQDYFFRFNGKTIEPMTDEQARKIKWKGLLSEAPAGK